MKTWADAQLGTFSYEEDYGWSREIDLQAFSVFKYKGFANPKDKNNTSIVDFTIAAYDEEEVPIEEIVSVARMTINNHHKLLNEGLLALFNRGFNSLVQQVD